MPHTNGPRPVPAINARATGYCSGWEMEVRLDICETPVADALQPRVTNANFLLIRISTLASINGGEPWSPKEGAGAGRKDTLFLVAEAPWIANWMVGLGDGDG